MGTQLSMSIGNGFKDIALDDLKQRVQNFVQTKRSLVQKKKEEFNELLQAETLRYVALVLSDFDQQDIKLIKRLCYTTYTGFDEEEEKIDLIGHLQAVIQNNPIPFIGSESLTMNITKQEAAVRFEIVRSNIKERMTRINRTLACFDLQLEHAFVGSDIVFTLQVLTGSNQ